MFRSFQIHLGSLLTGHNPEKYLWYHQAPSNYGKTTLFNDIIKPVLGPFLVECNSDMLLQQHKVRDVHQHTAGFMPLCKARVGWCEEMSNAPGADCCDKLIKLFCGGGPITMPVRAPCGQQQQRKVSFKLVGVGNFPLKMSGTDAAALGRLHTFAYRTRFSPDPNHPAKMIADGIKARPDFLDEAFSWLVKGALMWYRNNRATPLCKFSAVAIAEHRNQSAPVEAFLTAMCQPPFLCATEDDKQRCKRDKFYEVRDVLFAAYELWLQAEERVGRDDAGGRAKTINKRKSEFYENLTSRGHVQTKFKVDGREPRVFLGIKLLELAPGDGHNEIAQPDDTN